MTPALRPRHQRHTVGRADDAKVDAGELAARRRLSIELQAGPEKGLSATVESVADVGSRAVGASTKAIYTVPSNSRSWGRLPLTALIGRVPIDGTVNDPYPFKVLIGPDSLTANGIDIPDVAGAVVSGTASGDWTPRACAGRSLGHVRVQDGTIRTLPQGQQGQQRQRRAKTGPAPGGLGWISDYGIPCVSGERRSNAQQYLGSQALITAAGAGAASLIDSDNGSVAVVANSNGSLGTVGISGNEAMGRILAGGVRDMADWVNKLCSQHSRRSMCSPAPRWPCIWNNRSTSTTTPGGRRVPHRTGGSHASDLD